MAYNALVREYSAHSLEIRGYWLIADFKQIPADWKIRYNCKVIDRKTTNASDLCCSSKNPIQIYKPSKNLFPVEVCTTKGKSIIVLVSPTDTIKLLKFKIYQLNQSYIPKDHSIKFKPKWYEDYCNDGHTLSALGINSASKVFLKNSNLFASNPTYQQPDMNSTYTPQSFENISTPDWAKYAAGLNIVGRCSNQFCDTNDIKFALDVVARPVRYGDVVMNFARSQNPLNCSICCVNPLWISGGGSQFKIVPKRLVLSEARATISYRKSGENVAHQEFFKHKVGDGKFRTVFETSGGQLDVLEIKVVEPWNSPFSCVKCDTMIGRKMFEKRLKCGHVYHNWCIKSYKSKSCEVCYPKS